MDRYSLSIYDVYFDGDYVNNDITNNNSNSSDDIIYCILVNKIKVQCKENMEGVKKRKLLI